MENLNLSWSLRPILILLRFLGVDLYDRNNKEQESKIHFLLKAFYFLVLFVCNVFAQAGSLTIAIFRFTGKVTSQAYENQRETEIQKTAISLLNELVDYLNFTINCIVSHLLLLTVVRKQWKKLIESFHLLEKQQLETQFFIQLRRVSILGSILIVTLVLNNILFLEIYQTVIPCVKLNFFFSYLSYLDYAHYFRIYVRRLAK